MALTPLLLTLALTSGAIPASSTPARAAEKGQKTAKISPPDIAQQWRGRMQELYKVLAELVVDVSSDTRFNDIANRKRIEANAKKLSDLAHSVNLAGAADHAEETKALSQLGITDPSLKFISRSFQDEARRAYSSLRAGNRGYARDILTGISSYCIACHTRNSSGPSFSQLPLPEAAQKLGPMEKGRFFAATRQFDQALPLFEKVIGEADLSRERPLDSALAARYALAIAIRVKKDPETALAIVDKIQNAKSAPYYLRQYAVLWKEEVKQWKEELGKPPKTEEGLFAEALRLTSAAREQQKYPADRSADVLYLRASSVLHDLLQTAPEGKHVVEAFLMAGMAYEVLRDLNLDDVHETYYEACIRKAPATATAELCYRRYEQSVLNGFTGSSGTHLPSEMSARLQELQKLAITGPTPEPSPSPRVLK